MINIWLLQSKFDLKYKKNIYHRIYCVTPYSSSERILPSFFHRISGDGLPVAKHFNCTVVPSGWMTFVGSVWLSSFLETNAGASRKSNFYSKSLCAFLLSDELPPLIESTSHAMRFCCSMLLLFEIVRLAETKNRSSSFKNKKMKRIQRTLNVNLKLCLNITETIDNITFI